MSNKYCVTCGHEKQKHIHKMYACKVKGCKCLFFERGAILDSWGNPIK